MKGPQSLLSRLVALASASAIATVAMLAVGAAPAQAAPLGTITLTPTSGTVDTNPMLTSGTSSAACPTDYGQNAVLRVGPIGGPYNNLNRIGSAGNYDQAPFTLTTNRSLTAALGTTPAPGDYEIVIECSGVLTGTHPDRFITTITVTGNNWAVRTGPGPSSSPTPTVSSGTSVSLNASIAPSTGGSPSESPSVSTSPTAPGDGGGLPTTGFPLALVALVGAVLVGGGAATIRAARKRRATQAP
jgi:hypothetical protein